MTKKKYSLTDEHRAQLKPWADKWTANAMSTKPMDENDREICRDAVENMYKAAKLTPPPRHRIVFVPSPFVLKFAGGFAAGIWHDRKANSGSTDAATRDATYAATDAATDAATRDATYAATDAATRDATYAATRAATDAATRDATYAATRDATYAATRDATDAATYAATDAATYAATDAATRDATDAATDAATRDATYAATRDATYAATRAATDAATRDATYAATRDATYAATRDGRKRKESWFSLNVKLMVDVSFSFGATRAKFLLSCAANAYSMWAGGNQWSSWDGFITFFRHVAKLPLDYSKYDAWETLSLHSGPRIMHADFCMISDRPEVLTVDEQNRPHNETGPFCKWSDGVGLYSIHGVRVPQYLVENPEQLTADDIRNERNAEIRRIMMQRFGFDRYVKEIGAKLMNTDEVGKLWRVEDEAPFHLAEVLNSTPEPDGSIKTYFIPLPDENDLTGKRIATCREGVAWTFGLHAAEYRPAVET